MVRLSLEQALQLLAMVRWLARLFVEQQMAFALAAQCVELVTALRGPDADRAARALVALTA